MKTIIEMGFIKMIQYLQESETFFVLLLGINTNTKWSESTRISNAWERSIKFDYPNDQPL